LILRILRVEDAQRIVFQALFRVLAELFGLGPQMLGEGVAVALAGAGAAE
jgi:hypothetical protein